MGDHVSVEELGALPIFHGIPHRHLKRIAGLVEIRDVAKDTELLREGTFSREFFVILRGSAAVSVRSKRRDTLGSKDFFGELSIINHSARTASVTTLEDSRLGVIDAHDFQRLLEEEPSVALYLLGTLSRRLEDVMVRPIGDLE